MRTKVVAVHVDPHGRRRPSATGWWSSRSTPTLMIRGNLLTLSRNCADVVIGAFELEPDRPFGVQLASGRSPAAGTCGSSGSTATAIVWMRRSRSATSFSSGRIAFRLSSRDSEIADLGAELRQLARRLEPGGDAGLDRRRAPPGAPSAPRAAATRRSSSRRRSPTAPMTAKTTQLAPPRQLVHRQASHGRLPSSAAWPLGGGGGGCSPAIWKVPLTVKLMSSGSVRRRRHHFARHDLDRPGEVARALEVGDEVGQRGERQAVALHRHVVAGLRHLGEPHHVGQRAAHLVEHVDRRRLTAAQFLDQADALLQPLAARLEVAHLGDHLGEPLFLAALRPRCRARPGRRPGRAPSSASRRTAPASSRIRLPPRAIFCAGLQPERRRLGLAPLAGEEVDANHRSPPLRSARPTATAHTGAKSSTRADLQLGGVERHLAERIEALDLGVEPLAHRLVEALDAATRRRSAPPGRCGRWPRSPCRSRRSSRPRAARCR